MTGSYDVIFSDDAITDLDAIRNQVTVGLIVARCERLSSDWESGKRLGGQLTGYRSVRAARGRYRIIYRVENHIVTIHILRIGPRKGEDHDDIYRQFERMIERAAKLN